MGKKFVPGMWLLMFQVFVAITLEHKEKLDHMKWQTERMRRSWNLAWVNIRSLSMQLDSFIKNFDRSQGKDYPIENDTESNEHHQDIAETLAYDCMKHLLSSPNPGALVRLMELYNQTNCNTQMLLIAEAYINGEVNIELDQNKTEE